MGSMLPGGAHVMGSGSFDGASRALAANPLPASRGEAAQYCKKRRRLVVLTSSGSMWRPSLHLFLWRYDSSGEDDPEGSDRDSPDMQIEGVHDMRASS